MYKVMLTLPILSFLMMACSNNMQENQAKLDKIYGPCDNHRQMSELKEIFVATRNAAGPDGEAESL